MSERPKVSPGDWIIIGKRIDAVVCDVYDETIEIVYLNRRNWAINEEVIWNNDHWEFKNDGPCGGYADQYPRLALYVSKLRGGRSREE